MIKGKTYKVDKSGVKGSPKHGSKPLNFIVPLSVEINQEDSGVSVVIFRLQSAKKLVKENGVTFARYFIYEGIDKTEEELFDWAMSDDNLIANDGNKLKLSKASEV